MKYSVTRFKSLTAALKELEPLIRNGEHLQTGKAFEQFGGMRSREMLANIVFLNAGAGIWHPNRIARQLPKPLHFAAVWAVGLQFVDAGEYVYAVTNLDLSDGDAPAFLVRVSKEFDAWEVSRAQ